MSPVMDEPFWRRARRGLFGVGCGLVIGLGVVWASGLGVQDRARSSRAVPLDLSAACEVRDGPGAVAYFGGPDAPTSWRCARVEGDSWSTRPINPREACRLLHGSRSQANRASASSPFAWECRS